MPRLNLYKKAPSKRTLKFFVILFSLLLLETFLFIFLTSSQNASISGLEKEKERFSKNEQRLANMVSIEQKKALKAQPKKQEKFSMHEIQLNKKQPIQLLNVLARALPPKAWLKTIKEDKEKFHVTGYAFNNEIISNYIESLQNTGRFYEVNLLFSEKDKKSRYKKFSLTCFFKGDRS